MRYSLRICIPGRPGALGTVATALGAAGLDVVSLSVVEQADGVAVDDVGVEGDIGVAALCRVVEQVPGVAVEAITSMGPVQRGPTATALAADLAERRDHNWQRLVDGLCSAIGATWAVAVGDGAMGLQTLAASPGAPAVPAGVRLPFLPLQRPCRLPPAAWMPRAWCGQGGSARAEFAASALSAPSEAVLLARPEGPRFRQAELDRFCEIVRVAVAAADRVHAAV